MTKRAATKTARKARHQATNPRCASPPQYREGDVVLFQHDGEAGWLVTLQRGGKTHSTRGFTTRFLRTIHGAPFVMSMITSPECFERMLRAESRDEPPTTTDGSVVDDGSTQSKEGV